MLNMTEYLTGVCQRPAVTVVGMAGGVLVKGMRMQADVFVRRVTKGNWDLRGDKNGDSWWMVMRWCSRLSH